MRIAAGAFTGLLLLAPEHARASSCADLSDLGIQDAVIESAAVVAAGQFTPGADARQLERLQSFCRVALTLRPSADSDVKMEVWLPVDGWNGKFQAVGNGGWGGSINYAAMAEALERGYATSSTDTGHSGGSASFALRHPEKLVDFGYRAVHEMAVAAKRLIAAFYERAPSYSYWTGCSGGGRQGLKEAQRFPGDFDGILAGAPAHDFTGRAAQSLRIAQFIHADPQRYIPPEKYRMLHAAVLEACDANDGVTDGVLEDPTQCVFTPSRLQCTGADRPDCLTASQVVAARQIYSGATAPGVSREIPGLAYGSELGWATWAGPQPFRLSVDHFRYVVFKDEAWDYRTFNFRADMARADRMDDGTINALDSNLLPFFERGGKLLQYHGWSDPQISPGSSVNYYKSVVDRLGGAAKLSGSYRLFMVPGMAHCRGGEGPSEFDGLAALERWVENGSAPDVIVASRIRDSRADRTRPLCPFPQVAFYTGSGSTDQAANFVCRAAREPR